MARILRFTSGPADWQALLADPTKHWRTGYSARTLAHSWEAAEGFPPEVVLAMAKSADPLLAGLAPVLAVPEFKVPLPGGERASQNDIFVLARSTAGPVSIMIEGKVNESFGPTLPPCQTSCRFHMIADDPHWSAIYDKKFTFNRIPRASPEQSQATRYTQRSGRRH